MLLWTVKTCCSKNQHVKHDLSNLMRELKIYSTDAGSLSTKSSPTNIVRNYSFDNSVDQIGFRKVDAFFNIYKAIDK